MHIKRFDNQPFRRRLPPVLSFLLLLGVLLLAQSPAGAASGADSRTDEVWVNVSRVLGLTAGIITLYGFFIKFIPMRQRELFTLYQHSVMSVFGLSRRQCARIFRDRTIQQHILSPTHMLPDQWATLREALRREKVPEEALASSDAFYLDLLARMQASDNWNMRGKELAQNLTEKKAASAEAPTLAEDAPKDVPGMATFLFTDIEDSTVHWERLGKSFGPIKEVHDRLLRALAAAHHGREVVTTGDGFFFVFPTASLAIAFSIAVQIATVSDADLNKAIAPHADILPHGIKVRIGMHSGERVETDPGTFDGPNTNKAARVCGAGHGGQILVSGETYDSARLNLPPETTCLDLGLYRLKGIAEDVHLWQVDDPRLPERQFSCLTAPTPERVHLPRYLTPFLGRQEDVAHLQHLLADEVKRMVTLVGPGGVGKTRLSVQAAEGIAQRYSDGVWFVDLDSATQPEDVFARIVYRLALSSGASEADADRVTKFLAGKTLLFVLDNLEQIERPEEALRVLLDASPAVQCLASSRERVSLSGAQTYAVAPLPVPSASEDGDIDALQEVESVRFFLERAQAQAQDFALTPENAPSVARLCRQLEGIPLTLELAAAWTAQMTPAEILEGIETHLDLLRSEYADLPERQRTVRASIDWSFSRLSPDEQRFFALLSVFQGSFGRDAAQAVSEMAQTPDLLRRLVEKSLIKRLEAGSQTRFRLLNTTRLYAGERLDAQPDASAVRERHARFFARLAQEGTAQLRTPQEADAFRKLEDDLDNLKAATAWALGAGQPALAAALALALSTFLAARGWQREAAPYVTQGLDALQAAGDAKSPVYADLLRARAGLALDAFDYTRARQDAARLQEGAPDGSLALGHARNLLGIAARGEKQYAEAAAHFQAALDCFEAQGSATEAAGAENNLGVTLMEDPAGDQAEAERRINKALAQRQAQGDRRGIAEALTNLGNLREAARDYDGAADCYGQALAQERELRDTFGIARSLSNLGEVAEAQGKPAPACKLYAAGQYLFGRIGSPYQSYTQGLLERAAAKPGSGWPDGQAAFQSAAEKSQDALVAWAVGE